MISILDNFIDRYSDPRTAGVYSIGEPLGIVVAYILIVKKIGPWLMEDRKPMNIKNLVMLFDVIQIVANFYFVISTTYMLTQMTGPFFCKNVHTGDDPMGKLSVFLTLFYYWLKISDLLDTIFFVLRKSWRQVSYLHVYHHAIMIFISWMAVKLAPGGHCAYFGLANSVVHTAMYTYYLLSAYDPSYKQNLTLKRTITQVQLIQFVFIVVMFGPTIGSSCSLPSFIGIAATSQALYFLYLFGMFYYNSYIKIQDGSRSQQVKSK